MVLIAIAGATSGLGLTFLRVLSQDKEALAKHSFILLSRSPQPAWAAKGFDVRQTDYTSHEQLVVALKGVHTVLSFMGGAPEAILNGQLAIVKAAKAAGVTRFAPSEYAGDAAHDSIDLYKPKGVVLKAATDAGLQVTQFQSGLFLGLLATGTPKPATPEGIAEGCKSGEEEALGGVRPWNFVINTAGGTVDAIEDGSTKFAITDTRDIARFVIAALDLPTWPEKLGMRGSVTSFKDVAAYAGKVQGRKFLIKENSVAAIQHAADADPSTRFYNQARLAIHSGWALVGQDLNQLFPHIKPTTMEEFVDRWWSGVELPEPSWGEDKTFEPASKDYK